MGLIHISETQLAFGYLHSHLNVHRPRRFVLPSIRQEGGRVRFPFPGADIILNDNHLIQFKRPFYFTTNGIKEFENYSKPTDLNPPYFRFYIKNDSPTNQLQSLVRATQRGLTAEYISPLFTEEAEFNLLIQNDVQHLQSYAHIDVAQFSGMLGLIGNTNDHTVLYTIDSVNNNYCYCFSEPKKIKASKNRKANSKGRDNVSFKASQLLPDLHQIFFQKQERLIENRSLLSQVFELQQRLFIERNIIWTFKYELLR